MKKKCFALEISRFFYFCEIHRFQNLWCHHRHCYIMEVTLVLISFKSSSCTYFFWILSTIKMKFGQILVRCMINISDCLYSDLAQWWFTIDEIITGVLYILVDGYYCSLGGSIVIEILLSVITNLCRHWY